MHKEHFSTLENTTLLRLATTLFANSSDAMMVTDRANRIVAVNAAFTRLTGYSLDEVRGRDPRLLKSAATPPETFAAMWQTLQSDGTWSGEIWDKAKDGTIYPKLLNIAVVRDADGEVEHYLASFNDLAQRREDAERLAYLTQHDPLTRLANRGAMEIQLQQALTRAQRDHGQLAVMLIDLDRFKTINDTLGHQVGDGLLIAVAQRLRDCLRASDVIARLGGDEFVVILPDLENAMSVTGIASKLKRGLEDRYPVGAHTLYTTPSIGIAMYPIDGDTTEILLRNADMAMYHAKSQGRNNFQFFAEGMNIAANERMRLEDGMRRALESTHLGSNEFHLNFQPQLHLSTGRIVGIEALARWTHPELGPISPIKFIPVAEETGLIQPLGDWVFWESCRQLRSFKDQGITDIRIAVNLSAQQLRHESLPSVVHGALACYDLAPSEIELEITESVAMQNPAATIAILEQLSDMGIVLAIDDFGTGYSSLAYLKHLPIHRLKLDRAFVKDIETDRDDAAICSATIVLGHNLGLDLVAEGVETEGQRDYLQRLGCDVLQGFLYSRPLSADALVPFLKNWLAEHPADAASSAQPGP
jgi:diguanylate cyclase (GGDEF)-like protein/PAS domain S-box-containing protein